MTTRHQLNNTELANHIFLEGMYDDDYFPPELVQKGENILVELCRQIELAEEFDENDSEIETVARDTIATDMEYIAQSYGFEDADIEELVGPRDW